MKVALRLSLLNSGGTERVFISIANHMRSQGHLVDFIVDRLTHGRTEKSAASQGFPVISLAAERTATSIRKFTSYLNQENPDIVVSAYTDTNGAAIISCKLSHRRPPIVVTEHASLDQHWAGKPLRRRIVLESIARYTYRCADHIVGVSNGLTEQIRRRVTSVSTSTIHNPVRFSSRTQTKLAARSILNIEPDEKVLLAVGRITPQKNYEMLIRAFSEVRASARLIIVGDFDDALEKAKIDEYVRTLDLSSKVHFTGFTESVSLYYEAADLFVLSSAWEGFGNVLVEAMAFGLPIVSTRCNHGPAEILENGKYGDLVEVGDLEGMASAIDRNLFNPLCSAEALQKRAGDFSEANIGAQYEALLRSVVTRRHRLSASQYPS